MEIAVVVLAVICSQVLGRPAVNKLDQRVTNEIVDLEEHQFEFKLPTAIRDNTEIIINGTLISTEISIFSVLLPSLNNNLEEDCKITYDFNARELSVSPARGEKSVAYKLFSDYKGAQFSLKLKASSAKTEMVKITFEVFGTIASGSSDILNCKVDFDNLGYIQVNQGVAKVNEIHFKFK